MKKPTKTISVLGFKKSIEAFYQIDCTGLFQESSGILPLIQQVDRAKQHFEESNHLNELKIDEFTDYETIKMFIKDSPLQIFKEKGHQINETPKKMEIPDQTLQQTIISEQIPDNEVLLHISIGNCKSAQNPVVEFWVFASQKLTVIRDTLNCLSDFVSFEPGTINPNTIKTKISSSFIFIEDIFYIDTRWALAKDYSKPIIQWSRSASESEHYIKASMENSRFIDLKLKMHFNYLFMHQADCYHWIRFNEIRPLNLYDSRNILDYPIKTFESPMSIPACQVCQAYDAEKVTIDDEYCPRNPALWCRECFAKFHLDQSENRAYEKFKDFPLIYKK